MATLSAVDRRKLKYLPAPGQWPHGGAGLPACWNWALTGFGPLQYEPDALFSYVTYGDAMFPLAAIVANAGPAAQWFTGQNQNRLIALEAEWANFRGAGASQQRSSAVQRISTELVKIAIEVNGLTWVDNATPYELVMHYDPESRDGKVLYGPNWTHWWLRVDGGGAHNHNDGIEAFSGSNYLTIRRPQYSNNSNCIVYLRELHQVQVNRLHTILGQVIAHNHQAGAGVAHGAWVDAHECAVCGARVITGFTRHHCRCCGRTVCAECSPETRMTLLHGRASVDGRAMGPHRVCLYC